MSDTQRPTDVTEIAVQIPSPAGDAAEEKVSVQVAGSPEPDNDNVILVAHDFHHDHRAAGPGAWWPAMIGPGRPLDTDRYAVISPAYVGTGNDHAKDLRLSYLADGIASVLDALHIPQLHAVVGGSSGGIAALTFAVRHPHRIRRLISIASGARVTTLQSMHLAHQIAAIDLAEGDPDRLELAWRIFTVRRGSLAALESAAGSSSVDDIDRYLRQSSRHYWQHANPDSLRALLRAWRHFELAADTGIPDPTTALSRLGETAVLALGIDSDTLFYPAEQAHLTQLLEDAGVRTRRYTFHSNQGHDGWIQEPHIYGPLITEALT